MHLEVVNIVEALEVATPLLEPWWSVRKWPDAPPFSGGVYDAWPARDSDVCAVARDEEEAIWAFIEWRRASKAKGAGSG